MKSRFGYSSRLLAEMRHLHLSLLEKVLIASLLLVCLISSISSMYGRDIGNSKQLQLAKIQAQQDLMALRMSQSH
jgi:hypothetical protein